MIDESTPLATVGVVADTHIPDRVNALHPLIVPTLREAGVSHILHAGDISLPGVLETLRQIAPVTAVRGNRDLFAGQLRMIEEVEIGGVRLALMHGHGGWIPYLLDKVKHALYGYMLETYLPRLLGESGPVQVVVFGHSHRPVTLERGGKLLFNPGSASFGIYRENEPTIGLLRIYPHSVVRAETVPLVGYAIHHRNWEKNGRSG